MADPISIVSGCIRLAKEIYELKITIEADDAACSDFFYRIQALQVPLGELEKQQGSQLNTKRNSLDQINETLSNILNILNTRVKNKKSVFGFLKNAASSHSGKFSSCLSELNVQLDRCIIAVQLCTTVDMNSVILDMRAMLLQSQAASAVPIYVKDPPATDEYDDRSVLGKGAFGVTHRMINTVDKGVYAVKEIKVSDALSAGIKKDELLKEAMTLQKLNHPHIVRYFTSYFSRNETLFNVVMELISGGSLADKIGDPGVSVVDIRRWLSQMASTLHYLHSEMRTQHRDIKAENIMLTSGSGSRIKLIDLGTASAMKTVASKMSRVGTLDYFSYEKANGIPYDGRDDVWGAGCVFAELLVKARLSERGGAVYLFTNKTVNDRRLQLIEECAKVDVGLGSVIGRMLEPEQEHRCTSEELVRVMTDVVPSTSASLLPPAALHLHPSDSLTSSNESSSTGAFIHSLWSEKAFWDVGSIALAKFSPDGSVIAVAPFMSKIQIYDPSGRLIATMKDSDKEVTCLSFSPDGSKLAASSYGVKCVKLFEVSSGRLLCTTVDTFFQVCFFNSSSLVVSDCGNKCDIVDVSSGSITGRISANGSQGLCVSNRGTLITASFNTVTIWDNLSSHCLSINCFDMCCMCINSDGSLIYVGTYYGDIRVYSDSGLLIGEAMMVHDGHVYSLSMNETNSVLASGGRDNKVKLWNASTLECIQTLEGHSNSVRSVSFSPKNNNLVSGSFDYTVKVWSC